MAPKYHREASTPEPGFWGPEVVTITATGGERVFHIHARLLAHMSKYFRTALNSNFQEAQTREFTLTEHCDDTVLTMFTGWVYHRHIVSKEIVKASGSANENIPTATFVKGWLFGDYIGAVDFQNTIIAIIYEMRDDFWRDNIMEEFWRCTPVNSVLDSLFFEMLCQAISRSTVQFHEECLFNGMEKFPAHVAPALARRLLHKEITGNWNPTDYGPRKSKGPYDLLEWMDFGNFLVKTEEEEEKDRNKKQEEERIQSDDDKPLRSVRRSRREQHLDVELRRKRKRMSYSSSEED
ncbi:hypothetical protein GGR57DRAFT_349241 [Xylariaceae sp. FL1272]|nr:hypothetical protein GGR57DRAFT_349241 [Xylariaceae sp. FL1272]